MLIACVAGPSLVASAATVTFNLTGSITDEAISGCGAIVNCGTLSVSYTFDSVAPDQNADPATGLYAVTALTISIDGIPFFSSADAVINIANFGLADQYGVLAFGPTVDFGDATLSVLFSDPTATAFNSDALPLEAIALTPLYPGSFQLNASDDAFQLLGTLDRLTAVPEPSSVVLLSLGIATMFSTRRLLRRR
jgi:hypothetical protein